MQPNPFDQPCDAKRMNKVAYYLLCGIFTGTGIFFIIQGLALFF
jgi:hypothetical protein